MSDQETRAIDSTVHASSDNAFEVSQFEELLKEYTARLHEALEGNRAAHFRTRASFLRAFAFAVFLGTGMTMVTGARFFAENRLYMALAFTGTLAVIIMLFTSVRPVGSRARDVQVLALSLLKIVDRASALQEYRELGFAEQLRLDLRLSEAEVAIEEAKVESDAFRQAEYNGRVARRNAVARPSKS